MLWQALIVRHGKQDGTRQMIDLLKLGKQNGHGRLRAAIETALATGCTDTAAVQHLFNAPDLNRTPCEAIDIGSVLALLSNYDREKLSHQCWHEGEKWSNVHGAKSPAVCTGSNNMGGKGEMTKAPSSLQDLRRSLYVKAKAEPAWRFWGLYVHVCKRDTLNEAYRMAKENDGAPEIDGITFEAIAESGVESFLEQIRDELVSNTYRPMRARKQEISQRGQENHCGPTATVRN